MKVENNKMVSLTYRLTENDANGTLIEETNEQKPFTFLFGIDRLIPGFENNVNNLKIDEAFAFSVNAADAYGEYDKNSVVELPVAVFHKEGKLDTGLCTVGNMIPMQNESGQMFYGMVREIRDTEVVMDFNHPLAGKNLHFKGKVIGIREATQEEIDQRLSHDHAGHGDSCNCGC